MACPNVCPNALSRSNLIFRNTIAMANSGIALLQSCLVNQQVTMKDVTICIIKDQMSRELRNPKLNSLSSIHTISLSLLTIKKRNTWHTCYMPTEQPSAWKTTSFNISSFHHHLIYGFIPSSLILTWTSSQWLINFSVFTVTILHTQAHFVNTALSHGPLVTSELP